MLDILKEKQLFENWMLAVLPLLAAASTLKAGLLLALAVLLAIFVSALAVYLLRSLLNEKTAPFAQLVISVGAVGIAYCLLRIPFKAEINGLGIYLSLAAVSAVIMVRSDFVINTDIKGLLSGCTVASLAGGAILIVASLIREFVGFGSILGFDIYAKYLTPVAFLTTPAGGLLTAAVFAILYGLWISESAGKGETER